MSTFELTSSSKSSPPAVDPATLACARAQHRTRKAEQLSLPLAQALRVDLRVEPVIAGDERGPQSDAIERLLAFARGREAVGVEVSADGVAVGEEEGVLREGDYAGAERCAVN